MCFHPFEVIDGRFTETFFKGGDGNLYKETWPGVPESNGGEAFYRRAGGHSKTRFVFGGSGKRIYFTYGTQISNLA